jgi:hypothetical protein
LKYNAVQLASALLINREIVDADETLFVFLSADQRLCDMAKLEGLAVENPTQHP